ncbi:unnamed protein product [Didymodactylos carnosus]|uniref:FBD domain-containing protein n=1 Tax=Didymodactylos carnosus TaxID=1234261 RepID=A0A815GFE0_9BILA|nr:unnamed protein product [Didymodactylos carnosus]CAF1338080.1 unnamed protein product [Didymodactylos carnosus]CAF4038677.1 unnamed protein product [Didymodactylos carnosus]CAF4196932.1 unnamed protein product [Didymodactylos carnosus]
MSSYMPILPFSSLTPGGYLFHDGQFDSDQAPYSFVLNAVPWLKTAIVEVTFATVHKKRSQPICVLSDVEKLSLTAYYLDIRSCLSLLQRIPKLKYLKVCLAKHSSPSNNTVSSPILSLTFLVLRLSYLTLDDLTTFLKSFPNVRRLNLIGDHVNDLCWCNDEKWTQFFQLFSNLRRFSAGIFVFHDTSSYLLLNDTNLKFKLNKYLAQRNFRMEKYSVQGSWIKANYKETQ